MRSRFNYMKAIQAAAVLLRCAGPSKTDNYMRLLKLLYMADRRSLKEIGRSITGDRVVAMEQGPVLSRVLNLIKGQDLHSSDWANFFEKDAYNIRLISDPGNGELCLYEIDALQAVWEENRSKDEWALVNETHTFPEWCKNNPGKSSKPIPLADILEAVGRLADLEAIEEKAQSSVAFDRFFAG